MVEAVHGLAVFGGLAAGFAQRLVGALGGRDGVVAVGGLTIELCPPFFGQPRADARAVMMLHEMGHWVGGSPTKPRDERHSLCEGGWNRNENMCYRERGALRADGAIYRGGNPRVLAQAYDAGDRGVEAVMLNNIDNFVSYMWNRWVDRGECLLDVRQAAPGGRAPVPQSKPIR